MLTRWSWSSLQLCQRARDPGRCSHMCHRHHSSQWDIRDSWIDSRLLRSDHPSWGPRSSTNSRCSAKQQKRSPRLYMFRSTSLVTDKSKCRLIHLLCWRRHSIRTGRLGLPRPSPKIPWPRRLWPRSKCVCTWRRKDCLQAERWMFSTSSLFLWSGVRDVDQINSWRSIQAHTAA